jgi:very-short-patch-repair endonuclease
MFGYITELGYEKNVDYYEQYPFSSYVLDFAFIQQRNPMRGLDIETDGYKWHSDSKQRQRDGYRTYRLMKAGWLVERFGEQFTLEDVKKILDKHEILPSK